MDKLLFQKEIHVPVFMFSARSLRGGSVLLVCFLCHCPLSASSLYELDPCSQWRERPLLPLLRLLLSLELVVLLLLSLLLLPLVLELLLELLRLLLLPLLELLPLLLLVELLLELLLLLLRLLLLLVLFLARPLLLLLVFVLDLLSGCTVKTGSTVTSVSFTDSIANSFLSSTKCPCS